MFASVCFCVCHSVGDFCICTCSAQLSMFHMERRFRNTLIIIIITLQGIWRNGVSAGTGLSGVGTPWLGEIENLISNFCLSVAAPVWAEPSLRMGGGWLVKHSGMQCWVVADVKEKDCCYCCCCCCHCRWGSSVGWSVLFAVSAWRKAKRQAPVTQTWCQVSFSSQSVRWPGHVHEIGHCDIDDHQYEGV